MDKMAEPFAIVSARMRIGRSLSPCARPRTKILIVVAVALAFVGLAGCSAQNPAPDFAYPTSQHSGSLGPYRQSANPAIAPHVVVASWYGPGFEGHPTSTGERYHEYGMTAASKTLPLGTRLRVTNPANGRSVEVRINDRGPYVRGRSIDLSKGAAQRLGMTRSGVAPVVIASPDGAPTPVSYSRPRGVVATAYHPAYPMTYAERSSPDTAARFKRRWPLWHSTRRVARVRHSRRHRRMVWNPVGAWIVGSLPRF
jgi:hypothetical protein